MNTTERFSDQLEKWLKGKGPKTLASLNETFAEKGFAVAFILLMITAALPIPTGGVTHVFEIMTVLLALELVIGRRTIWIPEKWQKHAKMGRFARGKMAAAILKLVRKMEHISRPRLKGVMNMTVFRTMTALLIIVLTVTAFFAPPFSGLDTLPAMGIVLIALSLILEDILLYIFGILVGSGGILVVIGLGTAITQGIKHLF